MIRIEKTVGCCYVKEIEVPNLFWYPLAIIASICKCISWVFFDIFLVLVDGFCEYRRSKKFKKTLSEEE